MDRQHPAVSVLAQLGGIDLIILESIQYFQETHGLAYPGRPWLAARAGCSVGTISRHVTKLRKLGLLERRFRRYRRRNGTWLTRSNLYRLLIHIGGGMKKMLRALFTDVRLRAATQAKKKKEDPEKTPVSHFQDETGPDTRPPEEYNLGFRE